jgi:hypothetical protein
MKALGRLTLFLVVCAGPLPARGQEPGQTPRPTVTDPVREPTEEELVRLAKDFPSFAALKDDAPFAYSGKVAMDAVRQGVALEEEKAFDYVLAFARKQPVERLKKYSTKDVPIENLYRPIRQDYLRELIHVEGNLALVLPMRPTKALTELDGIENLYEAWVSVRAPTTFRLVCLVVSELPAAVSPGENQNQRVSFDAYFFKLWHYETRAPKDPKDPDKHQWEKAPLFLGKTFEARGPAAVETTTYSPGMLVGLVGGLAVVGLVAVGLGLWLRKGDKNVRTAARQKIESTVRFEDNPGAPAGPVNRIADQF